VISSSADRGKMFAIWKEQLRCPWSLDHAEMQGPNFQKKKGCKTFMPFWCLHAILSISKRSAKQAPRILQPVGSSEKKQS
jgi:hypothetical protein